MNKWLYRAVGAVGVASGALLLSTGVAHAEAADEAKPTVDPQAMRGLVADLFTPTGGQHHLGLSIDVPTSLPREEFIGGLLGGGGGLGSLTSGLTGGLAGGGAGGGLLSGLTGGGSPLGGLTSGLTGGGGPLGGLTSGLTGGGGPLGGLTSGLTGGSGGGLLSGLTGGGGPLGSLTSGLTGGLTGGGSSLGGLTSGLTGGGGPLGGLTGGGGPLGGLTGGDSALGAVTGGLLGGGDRSAHKPAVTAADLAKILGPDQVTRAGEGPASTDIIDPSLRGTALDTTGQRPIQLDPDLARQFNDATGPMMSAMIADVVAHRMGADLDTPFDLGDTMDFDADMQMPTGNEEVLPVVDGLPVVGALLGQGGPLSQVIVVGDMFGRLPIVGDVLSGNFDPAKLTQLPIVRQLLSDGLLKTSDGPSLPLVGSLPFVGGALNDLTAQTTKAVTRPHGPVAGLTQNPLGLLSAGATGAAPNQAPLQRPFGVTQDGQQTARAPIHVGKHRATDRPELVDDDYAESGSLPLIGALTGGNGGVGTLPLSTLVRNVPIVNQVPLVGELSTPLRILKSLPLVSTLAGLLPVESGFAA